jgi:predicted permease
MENVRQDIRVALRSLRRTPTFAIAAVLTLALGIGATTSVFSVAYGILLKPLPFRDPTMLVAVWAHNPTLQPEHFPLWGEEYKAFARESQSFSRTAIYEYHGALERMVQLGDTAIMAHTSFVSGAFFDVLGVRPRLGRLIRVDDDVFGTENVAVISEPFWRRAFGADPEVIGRKAILFTKTFTIIGVVPGGLDLPIGTDIWTTTQASFRSANGDTLQGFYDVVGRLKPGASAHQVEAELAGFLNRKTEPHSGARTMVGNTLRPVVAPIADVIIGDVRPAIRIVVGSVILLLLVTCINIANLQLVRAVGRRREFAVRAALGASRARVAQQVFVESGVIALCGAAIGVLMSRLAISLFLAAAPAGLPRVDQVGANGPVLIAALVLAVGVAVIVGLLPVMMVERLSLAENLRERQGGDSGSGTHRTRSLLVGAQVAVAVAVLAAAGVVRRSFLQLSHLDLGFSSDHLLVAKVATASVDPSIDTMSTGTARFRRSMDVLDNVMTRVRALPGVSSATWLIAAPFQPTGLDVAYSLPGDDARATSGRAMVDGLAADADYFRTLRIPIRKGRAFTDADRENAAHVAIVDESMARAIWPGQGPIGKQIGFGNDFHTVVGVAGETHYRDLLRPRQSLYMPYRQSFNASPSFLALRTTGNPATLGASLRAAVHEAAPHLTVAQITTLTDRIDATTAQPRLDALLLAGFAISILLLTAIGLYSIAATYVRHREFEIAVRIALGATPVEVVRLVLGQGVAMLAVGATVGVIVVLIGAGVLHSIVYGVRERDPIVLSVALLGVASIAFIAFLLPARRASRANPAEVLRAG